MLEKNTIESLPERIKWLCFWPIFGSCFYFLELCESRNYHYVHCFIDDKIPFCEYFVIPYYFWFAMLFGMIIYGFFWDLQAFRNYMKFTMISYLVALFTYIIYPNAQGLRPVSLAGDSIFIKIVMLLYKSDTNTNVCPSIHVLGTMAVYFAARRSRLFSSKKWRLPFILTAVLITSSTVFLKQHSIIDIIAAFAVVLIVYPFVYKRDTATVKEPESVNVCV